MRSRTVRRNSGGITISSPFTLIEHAHTTIAGTGSSNENTVAQLTRLTKFSDLAYNSHKSKPLL